MIRLRSLRRLKADENGAAVVEFSLWTVLFFMVSLAGLDFGAFYLQRSAADEAVSAAAVSAFSKRTNVNFSDLPAYVKALSDDPALTVTTACNGVNASCTNLSRTCACLKSNGTYVSGTCGAACSGTGITTGSTAGYYLTVTASKAYDPMILPSGTLVPATVKQSATVRLQ